MVYVYLLLAIASEVIATSALKPALGFTKLWPSLIVVCGYGISFYLLSLILQTLPVGVTYAIWSGLGIVLTTLIGIAFFRQIPDLPAILGLILIVAGVAVIFLFSKTMNH